MSDGGDPDAKLNTGAIPLGATRPAMVPYVGLPLAAALVLVVGAAEVQMAVTGLQGLGYAIAFLLVFGLPLRIWVAFDWYAVGNIGVWLRTMGPALDTGRWQAATVSHMPAHPRLIRSEAGRGMTA